MIPIFVFVLLFIPIIVAQLRCDAPDVEVYCNTTSILQYESASCTPYHIFIARGSDETYPGRLGNLTSLICGALSPNSNSACSFENVVFPAKSTAWGKDEWCKSAGVGAKNGQAQMRSYGQKCSQSKLIVLGFSQGAAVVQDMLGGGGGPVFSCVEPETGALDRWDAPGANVIAAATFGAVVRSRGQSFTIGDGKSFDGQRARTASQLASLNQYASVLRDYCHFGDPMCAVGSEPKSVTAHLNYFLLHNEEVVEWVVKMANAAESSLQSATSSSLSLSRSPPASSSARAAPTPPANAASPSARQATNTPIASANSSSSSQSNSRTSLIRGSNTSPRSTAGTSGQATATTGSNQTSGAQRTISSGPWNMVIKIPLWLIMKNGISV